MTKISLLANLSDSLQWLSEQIESLGSGPSFAKKDTKIPNKHALHRAATDKAKRNNKKKILSFVYIFFRTIE